jgi:hypothetical protein
MPGPQSPQLRKREGETDPIQLRGPLLTFNAPFRRCEKCCCKRNPDERSNIRVGTCTPLRHPRVSLAGEGAPAWCWRPRTDGPTLAPGWEGIDGRAS